MTSVGKVGVVARLYRVVNVVLFFIYQAISTVLFFIFWAQDVKHTFATEGFVWAIVWMNTGAVILATLWAQTWPVTVAWFFCKQAGMGFVPAAFFTTTVFITMVSVCTGAYHAYAATHQD